MEGSVNTQKNGGYLKDRHTLAGKAVMGLCSAGEQSREGHSRTAKRRGEKSREESPVLAESIRPTA